MSGETVTNINDQRQETRVNVNLQEQHNEFFMEVAGQTIAINNIRDVSVSGVGLELDHIIAQGETIALGYQSDDFNMKIKGTVAWCDASDGPTSIGVEFSSDSPQDNMLFFMAMRKFLDQFDGTTTMDA